MYMPEVWEIVFRLAIHLETAAFSLAALRAGSNIEINVAMMAITTSNSIKVNPRLFMILLLPSTMMVIVSKLHSRLAAPPGSDRLGCARRGDDTQTR
jgi:hypothetical protein